MVGDGYCIVGGRDEQVNRAAKLNIAIDFRFAGIFGVKDHQRFAPDLVADSYQAFAVVEPFEQAVAYSIRHAMLEDRSFPVTKRKGLAARGDCQRVALWVQRGAVQVAPGEDKLAIALGARAGQAHWKMSRARLVGIEQV